MYAFSPESISLAMNFLFYLGGKGWKTLVTVKQH
jgi:hypothetical protein